MKKKTTFPLIILLTIILFSCNSTKKQQYIDFVNPFIGTGGHGHTFPGATMPFGMVQLSPDTRLTGWDGCSGYHYSDEIIYGFSHTHLSGTGVADYCDILFMPTTGKIQLNSGYIDENNKTNIGYGSKFSKTNEFASPGYYSVFLDDYKIKAELTSSIRCGMHKYTYPKSKQANIIIDLTHRDKVLASDIEIISDTEIAGTRISQSWAKKQHLYFYAKFSQPIVKYGIAINDKIVRISIDDMNTGKILKKANGTNIKAYLTFETKKNEEIIVKVGISAVSIEGAKKNLEAEMLDKDFNTIKQETETAWEKELSKIEVEGGTKEQKIIFYTALYHSFIAPNLFQDVDGKYRGTDLKIHKSKEHTNYTIFSLWDTYRATHPLYTIIQQKRTNDFIKTFITQYENGGQLPVWELAGNYTGCMIGYHSIPVIADAYLKGINDFDIEKAYNAMKNSAEQEKLGLKYYNELAYIPFNFEHESVSKTLEYAYDDWCIAQVAKSLNKDDDYEKYIKRAQFYKNLYEPKTAFMRAKTNAVWCEPFNPSEVNFNYTEANSWQYTFYVPQDITGFIKLLGGIENFDEKLDNLFSASTETTGREQADITGLIGQYAHGNEPSHHIAYLYNFAGKAWKTQQMVSQIMAEMYSTKPDGLIGNEDCGQMSSWYVLSAMGFYPVTPATDYYVIGSPIFEKVTIHLENGKDFVIKSNNVSKENIYIQNANLNKKNYSKSFIKHQDIINGGEIIFEMGKSPNKKWGNTINNLPETSITENLITIAPFIYTENTIFTNFRLIELASINKNDRIYYTFDKNLPLEKYKIYTSQIKITESTNIQFYAETEQNARSKIMNASFVKLPKNLKITYAESYSEQYTASGNMALIDGIFGTEDFRIGAWQGFYGKNLNITIDYGKKRPIEYLSIRFLQDINSWIFMPETVQFYVSDNGKDFVTVGKVENDIAQDNWDILIKNFQINVYPKKARYVRIIAKNIALCPINHKAAGEKAWIFSDEIIIK